MHEEPTVTIPDPETTLLASLLMDRAFLEKPGVQNLNPEDFENIPKRNLFQLLKSTKNVDPAFLKANLPRSADSLIWDVYQLSLTFFSPPNAEEMARIISQKALLRRFREAAKQLELLAENTTAKPESLSKRATEIFQALVLEETEPEKASEPTAAFPIEVYPEWLQQYCLGLAESISCPVDFLGASVLAVASLACGKKIKIELKPDWPETGSLYLAIVGSPSSGKSPAMLKAMAPIFHLESLFQDENEAKDKAFDEEKLKYEVAKEAWKKAQKDGNAFSKMPESPEKSRYSRAYTSDFTVESLAPILADGNSLLLYQDELSEWILKQNQYKGGKGGDKQFYLRAWSGNNCPIDRRGAKTLYVKSPYLTVLGGLVPGNIPLIKGDTHDGFIDRVLFAFPEPKLKEWSNYSLPQEIYTRYNDEIFRIFRTSEKTLVLTEEARELFIEWNNYLAKEIFEETNDWISSSLGKFHGYTARIALLLCLLENRDHCLVEKKDVLGAIKLAQYFIVNAKKIFREIGKTQEQKEQDVILNYAKKRRLEKVTCRELSRAGVPGCIKSVDARDKMGKLVEDGLAIWVVPGKEIKIL